MARRLECSSIVNDLSLCPCISVHLRCAGFFWGREVELTEFVCLNFRGMLKVDEFAPENHAFDAFLGVLLYCGSSDHSLLSCSEAYPVVLAFVEIRVKIFFGCQPKTRFFTLSPEV